MLTLIHEWVCAALFESSVCLTQLCVMETHFLLLSISVNGEQIHFVLERSKLLSFTEHGQDHKYRALFISVANVGSCYSQLSLLTDFFQISITASHTTERDDSLSF